MKKIGKWLTYNDVVAFEGIGLGLDALRAESLTVDKGAVAGLDVADVNLFL